MNFELDNLASTTGMAVSNFLEHTLHGYNLKSVMNKSTYTYTRKVKSENVCFTGSVKTPSVGSEGSQSSVPRLFRVETPCRTAPEVGGSATGDSSFWSIFIGVDRTMPSVLANSDLTKVTASHTNP